MRKGFTQEPAPEQSTEAWRRVVYAEEKGTRARGRGSRACGSVEGERA